MLERLRLSLWDIYSTLITGAIILAVLFYLKLVDAFLPPLKLDGSKILTYLFVCYALGLIYEPISKKAFSKIDKAYMKWLSK